MRMAIIEEGVVVNIIEAEDENSLPGMLLVSALMANIGDLYSDGEFTRPEPVQTKEESNAVILAQLAAIDAKSIRPLRSGDAARVADLEAQAVTLRSQLKK